MKKSKKEKGYLQVTVYSIKGSPNYIPALYRGGASGIGFNEIVNLQMRFASEDSVALMLRPDDALVVQLADRNQPCRCVEFREHVRRAHLLDLFPFPQGPDASPLAGSQVGQGLTRQVGWKFQHSEHIQVSAHGSSCCFSGPDVLPQYVGAKDHASRRT